MADETIPQLANVQAPVLNALDLLVKCVWVSGTDTAIPANNTYGDGQNMFVKDFIALAAQIMQPIAIAAGVVTASLPLFSAAQTWNNAGVTFAGIKLSITDTASNSASLLLDLQIGGSSKFSVRKDGTITAGIWNAGAVTSTGAVTGTYHAATGTGSGNSFGLAGANNPAIYVNSVKSLDITSSLATLASGILLRADGGFAIGTASLGTSLFVVSGSGTNVRTTIICTNAANSANTIMQNDLGSHLAFGMSGSTNSDLFGGVGAAYFATTAGSPPLNIGTTGATALTLWTNNGARLTLASDGGLYTGAATGSSKGAGTLNLAADIYKNGTAYSNPDYVLEHWATGKITKFADKEGAANYPGLMPLAAIRSFVNDNWHLPRFGQRADHGMFSGSDALLASVEEAYLHLFDHEDRIAALERNLAA